MRIAWLALIALAGCTYSLTPPVPSRLSLDLPKDPPGIALSLVDERPADGPPFIVWDSFGNFPDEAPPTDPPQFLAQQAQLELVSRGLPVTIAVGDHGLPRIHLRTFRVRGYRQKLEVYEPVIARVLISADLETASGRKRLGVFTAGQDGLGTEVIAAVVSQPLAMAVKEFAAKLANELYDYRASDDTVVEIASLTVPLHLGSYRNVYALGFTNNPKAIPLMEQIVRGPSALVANPDKWTNGYLEDRALIAAVASLGTLRATERLAQLQAIYENRDLGWRIRCMAAKSIGDLGTKQALDYLSAQIASGKISPSYERGAFLAQVIELYL